MKEVLPDLKQDNTDVWVVDYASEEFNTLLDKVENVSGETLENIPKVNIMSNFLLIFTSGTTGTVDTFYWDYTMLTENLRQEEKTLQTVSVLRFNVSGHN